LALPRVGSFVMITKAARKENSIFRRLADEVE